eukprot:CAMPEP_0184287842 /NCGR_PEP_ID=MMETSP1049-20130417/214_1 /TAXON_ID=77928 /ORGANISM="Proteomonas sulcata, Strain CCMP704" /LENGTH=41 /DNA_ID= /DNA_START= /DNA_END= /DNA_ORIENTATION=
MAGAAGPRGGPGGVWVGVPPPRGWGLGWSSARGPPLRATAP